jgi:geranylgeranyl reductase family protein|tara:strand:- start:69 stop:1292 length:1224 start_codon:yes stop_codon:yes gene_type:complete
MEDMWDLIIVGAGPAGCSAAYFNAQQGKRVLLLDAKSFPRDKICGDGITGKALTILYEMGLEDKINAIKSIVSTGVVLSSPNKKEIRIPLTSEHDRLMPFSLERCLIDNSIYEVATQMVKDNGGEVRTEKVVATLSENGVMNGVRTTEGKYFGKIIVGAGGYSCPVSRTILTRNQEERQDRQHYSSAVREYWSNISGSQGDFEIHFIDGIMPGYFWIFPLSNNRYNIGVGMLLADMDDQQVKLKQMLKWITEESYLSHRFKDAKPTEKSLRGWMLPLGSPRDGELNPRCNYVEGGILLGDAASLIDPFTGEGIGNALVSGKLLADYDKIDNTTGPAYQQELWNLIGTELTNSHRLQKMLKRKWLINWVIKKASKKPKLQQILTDMLNNKETQGNANSKWFLLKALLF